MMNRILIFMVVLFALSSCKKFTDPAPQNNGDFENIYTEPALAHGILLNGYTRLPSNFWNFNDVATDDAVSNDINNNYRRIATGQWSSILNPLDQWTNARAGIQYVNLFLAEADKVLWDSQDPKLNKMFNDRQKGEAYALRAYLMMYMLQAHSGKVGGTMYGFPLVLEPETPASNFNQPRATFDACLKQIYSDLDKAEELLPLDYRDITAASQIPAKYAGVNTETYNRVFGKFFNLRMTGRISKAIRAKVALLAASPAYSGSNATTWENAANYTAQVLALNGWLTNLDPNGVTWYDNRAEIDGLASGSSPREMLWRTNVGSNSDLEAANYPPTLSGQGRINPTQNLVNAFPMANGFPITVAGSNYNASTPYTARDPRLAKFIVYNGNTVGPTNKVINTTTDLATNDDGLNIRGEVSTRTGYYMKKLLRQDVSRNPTVNNQKHYKPHIRYTELFLNYAEAANEAWGPLGTGGNAHSAYDIIKAIRARAGVGTTNGDAYLESIKVDKDAMRTLIRNERRLELAFEGFRFWDLRRWNATLNEPVKGMSISQGTYQEINVETRSYQEYMRFGPIPYSEILKYNSLQQNTGW